MNKIITLIIVIVLVGVGAFLFIKKPFSYNAPEESEFVDAVEDADDMEDQEEEEAMNRVAEEIIIGQSVEGRDIVAYNFGDLSVESRQVLLVGGIHGGYSWNTSLLAFELMDYFGAMSEEELPKNVRVTVIPALNSDGLSDTLGITATDRVARFNKSDVPADENKRIAGRFNVNTVDLNRNFDCDWKTKSTWQSREVSGGSGVFSEPEARAVRDYILQNRPSAVVVYYSASGGVFASNCHDGVLEETSTLTDLYSKASGYKAYNEFNFYDISGDMVNWIAKEGIPAISILLTNHTDTELDKNKSGVNALIKYYVDMFEAEDVSGADDNTTDDGS